MGRMLNSAECRLIKKLREEFKPYAEKGWMSEGSDAIDRAIGICFNNDTDESFFYDEDGNVLSPNLTVTSVWEAEQMAKIEALISAV